MGRSVAPRRRNERSGDEENELKIGGENDLGVKANNRMLVAEVPTQGPAPLAIRSIAHGALVRVPHWLCSLAPAVPHQRGKKISPFNLVEKKLVEKKQPRYGTLKPKTKWNNCGGVISSSRRLWRVPLMRRMEWTHARDRLTNWKRSRKRQKLEHDIADGLTPSWQRSFIVTRCFWSPDVIEKKKWFRKPLKRSNRACNLGEILKNI